MRRSRFLAYDLIEEGGVDLRALPFATRRARLEKLVEVSERLLVSPEVSAGSWDELAALRAGCARAQGRGADAETARCSLRRRPAARRLVEVEDRTR